MEEEMSSLAVTHLLQHTLRSLCCCCTNNSQWVYAVFWRILPRNYPPPKWDSHQGGAYDRSRGNRRNWILVWEDGFCNFGASSSSSSSSSPHHHEMNGGGEGEEDYHNHHLNQCPTNSLVYDYNHHHQGLQPELFFKMSHEIYNYGEGLIGKVAADHSHKWIYKEQNHNNNNNNNNNNQEINFLSAWHNSPDSHPRTWEAQFQSGIKTIALIAVREGVIQLGAVHKVIEDLSYVVLLRKKFSYIESIPGVLLPHPSSTLPAPPLPYPFISVGAGGSAVGSYSDGASAGGGGWQHFHHHYNNLITPSQVHIPPPPAPTPGEFYDHYNINQQQQHHPMKIAPSMSSLEALLSKLPSVVVPPPPAASTSPPPPVPILPGELAYHVEGHDDEQQQQYVTSSSTRSMDVGKEEEEGEEEDQEDEDQRKKKMKKMKKNKKNVVSGDFDHDLDQNSSSVSSYHHNNQHFSNYHHHNHQDLNHVSHGY